MDLLELAERVGRAVDRKRWWVVEVRTYWTVDHYLAAKAGTMPVVSKYYYCRWRWSAERKARSLDTMHEPGRRFMAAEAKVIGCVMRRPFPAAALGSLHAQTPETAI